VSAEYIRIHSPIVNRVTELPADLDELVDASLREKFLAVQRLCSEALRDGEAIVRNGATESVVS
jgi:hypothetical protein